MTRTLILKLEIAGVDETDYADTCTELLVDDFLRFCPYGGSAEGTAMSVLSDDGWPPKEEE